MVAIVVVVELVELILVDVCQCQPLIRIGRTRQGLRRDLACRPVWGYFEGQNSISEEAPGLDRSKREKEGVQKSRCFTEWKLRSPLGCPTIRSFYALVERTRKAGSQSPAYSRTQKIVGRFHRLCRKRTNICVQRSLLTELC